MSLKELRFELALRNSISTEMVDRIIEHPFRFLMQTMRSTDDMRPIRMRYLGAFSLKSKCNNPGKAHINTLRKMRIADSKNKKNEKLSN